MDAGRRVIMVFSNLDNECRLTESSQLKSMMRSLKENQFEVHFMYVNFFFFSLETLLQPMLIYTLV